MTKSGLASSHLQTEQKCLAPQMAHVALALVVLLIALNLQLGLAVLLLHPSLNLVMML